MTLVIDPQVALSDDPLSIVLRDLKPKCHVQFIAKTTDVFGQTWSSKNSFKADNRGEMNFEKQGFDAMRLIWSMRPAGKSSHKTVYIPPSEQSIDVDIQIKTDNVAKTVAIKRCFQSPSITICDVREENVVGRYFCPVDQGPHPAILLVSGSDGGIASQLNAAALLASRGYAVLVMAYFNYEGLKRELYHLPLKTFLSGVQWLRQQSEVDANRVAAMGPSKGAEGLLLAASYHPEMKLSALVAVSPSSVIWQGIGRGKPKPESSWMYRGDPLPYLSLSGEKIFPQFLVAKYIRRLGLSRLLPSLLRMSLAPAYSNVKKTTKDVERSTIPVENIEAPLCVIAGKKDRLWPSDFMARMIQNRRKTSRHAKEDQFLFYAHAGHQFHIPNLPTSITWRAPKGKGMIINFGGTPQGNAFAQRDAWQKILAFLKQHLA